ncbi:MAG: carboxypeptidase regulatory-like domain-containing protein [Thermoanaerobaculia bacterium]
MRQRPCHPALRALLLVGLIGATPVSGLSKASSTPRSADPGEASLVRTTEESLLRLESDFLRWSALEEARRAGKTVDTHGWTRRDFLEQLESLAARGGRLSPEAAERLRRKVDSLRSRLGSTGGLRVGPATRQGPVAIAPGATCDASPALSAGVYGWETGAGSREAWVRVPIGPDGGLRVQTTGSRADTALTLFSDCDGPTVGSDEDGFGLQSLLSVTATPGSELLLRITSRALAPHSPVVLTIEGSGTGGITGTVVGLDDGLPLESVRLELYDAVGSYQGSRYTSSTGNYSYTGLQPGSYYLWTDDVESHLNEIWDDHLCEPSCSLFDGDQIVVSDTVVSGIDFALAPADDLRSRIEVGGGPISLIGTVDLNGSTVSYASLDDGGSYEAYAHAPGTYFAYTSVFDFRNEVWDDIPCEPACSPMNGTPITLTAGQQLTGIDFALDRPGGIAGRIVDAQSGLPIDSANVRAYSSSGSYLGSTSSEPDGTWTIEGLLPGTYFVTTNLYGLFRNEVYDDVPCTPTCNPTSGQGIYVELSEVTGGIDFVLDRLGAVSGTVRDETSQLPVGGISVEIWNDAGQMVEAESATALGHYELINLQPDTYFVVTDGYGGYIDELYQDLPCPFGPPGGCDPLDGTPVPVALSQIVEGVDFSLGLGASVAGTLTDAATAAPLASRRVRLWRANGALLDERYTASNGRYFLSGLESGSYFVTTDTVSHRDELWDDLPCEPSCDPTSGTPVVAQAPAAVENVDFALVLLGGVAGTVTDDAGAPVQGVTLHAWSSQGFLYGAATTGPDGRYQIDLPSGIFYLSTRNEAGLPEELWDNVPCPDGPAVQGLCDPLQGDPITVLGSARRHWFRLRSRELRSSPTASSRATSAWSLVVP